MSDTTQLDLFGGEKSVKAKRPKPVQQAMFTAADLGFGVNAHPVADDVVALVLVTEDPRTEEQKEADLLQQARDLTLTLPEG